MLKLSHTKLIVISGLIWFAVGCYLLPLGLNLLIEGTKQDPDFVASKYPLLNYLNGIFGGLEQAALAIIVGALFIGFFKGRFVLGKTAKKGVDRIRAFPNPTSLGSIYTPRYYLLLGSMVLLGMSIKFFGLPNDVRGFVDVAIGSALINGAMVYFRSLTGPSKAVASGDGDCCSKTDAVNN